MNDVLEKVKLAGASIRLVTDRRIDVIPGRVLNDQLRVELRTNVTDIYQLARRAADVGQAIQDWAGGDSSRWGQLHNYLKGQYEAQPDRLDAEDWLIFWVNAHWGVAKAQSQILALGKRAKTNERLNEIAGKRADVSVYGRFAAAIHPKLCSALIMHKSLIERLERYLRRRLP